MLTVGWDDTMEKIQLENEIIRLRLMEEADVDAILEVSTDKRIWEHIAYSLITREDVEKYVNSNMKMISSKERLIFVIIDKLTGKIIGSTSIYAISEEHAHCEIGATWITPTYWRTSTNTTCKYLLFQYIFETLELERVQIKTDNLNERSQNAILRIGAKFEGRLRSHMRRKNGTMRDTMLYSIIKSEWPEVKKHLEDKLSQEEDR